jgi:hypothetical protein
MVEEDKNNSNNGNHDILSEDGIAPRKNFFDEALQMESGAGGI